MQSRVATFAGRLRQARKESGYSWKELTDQMGVSRQAMQAWEAGESTPLASNLFKLAELFGRPVSWLMGEAQEATGASPMSAAPKNRADACNPASEDRLGRLESVLERLVEELAATREELQASRRESQAARQATKALRKRLAATEAALAAPDLPSQAGAINPLRSTGSG